MLTALEAALEGVPLLPEDGATVELARTYARAIDLGTEELNKVGPKLLDALAALGMTPKGRAELLKAAGPKSTPNSKLDELRTKREQKRSRAGA